MSDRGSTFSRFVAGHVVTAAAVALIAVGLVVGFANSVSAQKGEPVVAFSAQTNGDDNKAQFVLSVSRPMAFSAFALMHPERVVIDLPPVDFEMAQGTGQIEQSFVQQFRFGVFGADRSRIVLDLKGPARLSRAYILPPVDGNPVRLVVEMERVSAEKMASSLRPIHVSANGKKSDQAVRALVDARPIPKKSAKGDPRPLVVLDPGHGGIDTGAVSASGLVESKLVLDFAKALKKRLEADGLVRVALTRETNKFVALGKRVAFAQARQADLFVSIHADSVREKYVRGATVYTLSDKASDAIAAGLAKQENRSDLLAGLELDKSDDVVADILIDLTRRETTTHSALYSRTLVGALKKSVRLSKTPERSAGFRVLKAPEIPSVLLELGYLSNVKDQSELKSKAWRKKAIDSIANSVQRFFARRAARLGATSTAG